MTDGRRECDGCEAEGLSRVLAVRDLLDAILWRQVHPISGIELARRSLNYAQRSFDAAGIEPEP